MILSDNPLTIEPMKINTIQVETIKDGKSVYVRKQAGIVDPATGANQSVWVGGLRAKVSF